MERNDREEKYVDYDEDTACWGIFGVDTGFCYETYTTEEEASEKLNSRLKKIALVDMDGTTANFDKAMQAGLAKIRNPLEPDNDGEFLAEREKLIKTQPGFWKNLEPIELGFQLINLLIEEDFFIKMFTKGPSENFGAWSEKKEWCLIHLPGKPLHIVEDKGGEYGKVLVDDYPKYIKSWLAHRPRGLVIMPDQPWNKKFTHPQVIRVCSVEDFPVIREKLRAL